MTKQIFDYIASFLGIVVLSPLLILIALWVKFDSKGPVLFVQQRVGLNGNMIGVFKFRTMVVDAEKLGLKITVGRDPRITKSGKFLRKYKLDELAQLFNVVSGSMSLVGPRPEVLEYINEYSEDIREKVLSVKPGITDLASIEFRNENDLLNASSDPHKTYVEEILPIKQSYYLRYVEEHSLFGDLIIIFKTMRSVLS